MFLKDGYKIQLKSWHKDYYIYLKENQLIDSMGNLYCADFKEYLDQNKVILDNSGYSWDVYDDDLDSHL